MANIKEVNSGEIKEIVVSGEWKNIYDHENNTSSEIEVTSTYKHGWRSSHRDERTVEVKHSIQAGISAGDIIKVLQLNFNYNYEHREATVLATEVEFHAEQEDSIRFKIPSKKRFTRWQFVVDIGGNDYGYNRTFDTLDGTVPRKPSVIKATVELSKQIQISVTKIRLKHKVQNRYLTIQERLRKPAATLGQSNLYNFILYKTGDSYKLRSLKTTKPGHEWLYANAFGDVFLDENQDGSESKYRWAISLPEPLRDGDAISFRNQEYGRCFLSYDSGIKSTDVFCKAKREDLWILEVVSSEDVNTVHGLNERRNVNIW